MIMWLRLALLGLLLSALGAGYAALRAHFVGVGQAQVQARWDAQKVIDQAESLRLERERNAQALTRYHNAQRIAHEQAQRAADLQRRIADSRAAIDSLLNTLAALDRRDLSAPVADAQPGTGVASAATARELLGQCAARYLGVATDADRLRDQVTGLQADAQLTRDLSQH